MKIEGIHKSTTVYIFAVDVYGALLRKRITHSRVVMKRLLQFFLVLSRIGKCHVMHIKFLSNVVK
jgi:hypothetical protein